MSEVFYARSFSTVTCGLLLGSTCWAGFAVMPSLIAAKTSTNAKIACFNGLIESAAKLLSPIAIATVRGFGVAAAATAAMIILQAPIVPRNKDMQRLLNERQEQYEKDDGAEGARRIGEIRDLNYGRIALSLVAMLACVYASDAESGSGLAVSSVLDAGRRYSGSGEPLAVRKPEYGLE
ncbi:hypothetical protein BCR37DRAFT_387258 [Protomyces lactucae-debilis]|uniref:Uncharacterized protein n=1 Tax=Protomyces lactucae-debilis TaxID=2754530 RepID=A0A1Y2FF57_PROLT|nr:uncharacterized protein BCR37DRAFT_387258 [Protomyces lactucae-debilis]ORY82563.1 hypothetical protein BCR37DRAFT_387258 [Protomyces lactucae-debilis]